VIMKRLIRFLDAGMKFGIILTTCVMIVTCTLQVLSRYLLPQPFSWTEEMSRYAFIWWSFLGAAYVVRLNGHLGMDMVVALLPSKLQVAIQKIVFVLVLAFMILVTILGVKIVLIEAGQAGVMIPISMGWIYAIVPFTGFIMVLYSIYLIFYWTPPIESLPQTDLKTIEPVRSQARDEIF
jgi:TRAP-type transport system small permease protein